MISIEFGSLANGKLFVDECNHMWRKTSSTTAVRVIITEKNGMVENVDAGAFDAEDRVYAVT